MAELSLGILVDIVDEEWARDTLPDNGRMTLKTRVKGAVPMDLSKGLYKVKSEFKHAMKFNCGSMEGNKELEEEFEEEEYVLIDLDGVADIHIRSNAPYVLSGLDTLNPILVMDDKIKLKGEYEETIGTCLVFNETDAAPVVHEETGSSEANLFAGKCIADPKAPGKQVNPIARLLKVLKFRQFSEADIEDATDNWANKPS